MTTKQLKVKHIQPLDLIKYAGASGDYNPVHTILEVAKKSGHPNTIAHGMYVMGLVSKALETWYPERKLSKFQVRFLSPTYSGDEMIVSETTIQQIQLEIYEGTIEVNDSQHRVKLKGTFELIGGKENEGSLSG